MLARHVHHRPEWAFRLQTLGFVLGTAVVAAAAGRFLANAPQGTTPTAVVGLAALAGGIMLFTIPVEKLFLGWLFLAPLFQNSADATSMGRPLVFAFYLAPVVAMLVYLRTGTQRRVPPTLSFIDVLPAAYVTYVVLSIALTTDLLGSDLLSTAKAVFQATAVGAVVYYFLVFGPGAGISATRVLRVLLAAAVVQSVLALVEFGSGWGVWGRSTWQDTDPPRSVATLVNPAALGVVIGAGIVIALSTLAWKDGRDLRRLSWVMIILGLPALLVTFTRAPIAATAIAGLGVLLLPRRTRPVAIGVLAVAALALVLFWPRLTSSELYQTRIADRTNIQGRSDIQDVSLRAAARKPFAGWGYGAFDTAKLEAAQGYTFRVPGALNTTSHNTYLTILVELGGLGLALWLLPKIAILFQGARGIRHATVDRWWILACTGGAVVWMLTANADDFKVFSFVNALPWIFLALIRRESWGGVRTSTS